MNSASTFEISKSSLLSLKAEVLRKQQEISKAKLQTKPQQPTLLKSKPRKNDFSNEPSNKGIQEREERDKCEDEDLLQKSKRMLESKARLYDKLAKGPANLTEEELEINKRLLVQFDRKPREDIHEDSDEEHFTDEYEPANNSDEEWVDYVDCLGRTRRCLRKDLSYLKEKDNELSDTLDAKRNNKETPKWEIDTEGNRDIDKPKELSEESFSENSELLSKDMRRELMRKEWEKQEEELLNKKNIHYQDVLFNEARSHGVGYYAFSKDEEERAKQQEELRKLRQETTQQQKASLEQKALREKQLAARLKAARNRKRARMGLPPEEDVEPEVTAVLAHDETSEEETKKQAVKETEEKAKEEARRRIVRPWDIGKEGLKKHYEYTQEEWVDKKRSERPNEFAPPTTYRTESKTQQKPEDTETDKSLYFTTKRPKKDKKDEREKIFWVDTSIPPPNFSQNPYKNINKLDTSTNKNTSFTPVPIVEESSNSDEEVINETPRNVNVKRQGVEIAPPPTYEYYGPTHTKSAKLSSKQSLEDSIAAGLRYLREQAEAKEKAAKKRYFYN